ncbi:MAG TPA: PP2C family serine/threonine-protein phosphatase [Planctomycetota bacterium]
MIGSSHVKSGSPCQDASAGEIVSPAGASVFLGVVSDGAGSAPLSQVGARTACRIWRDRAEARLAEGGGVLALDHAFALETLAAFQAAVGRLARRLDRPLRDFACTLLFAAVDEEHGAFAQIGDGAIVVGRAGETEMGGAPRYDWVFWPEHGEYVNQTRFATEAGAAAHLAHAALRGPLDELALFSDGLENLVLDTRRRVAHGRFFEPMFQAVRRAPAGRSEPLCRSLERFLASRTVEGRTDDDKSLILASRRASEPAPPLPLAVAGGAPHAAHHGSNEPR